MEQHSNNNQRWIGVMEISSFLSANSGDELNEAKAKANARTAGLPANKTEAVMEKKLGIAC